MRKIIPLLFLFSCKSYNVATYTNDNIPNACTHPTYLLTGAKKTANSGADLSLHDILKSVQTQYGGDVTIQNVRWDTDNKNRISVIYDVIRCNPEK